MSLLVRNTLLAHLRRPATWSVCCRYSAAPPAARPPNSHPGARPRKQQPFKYFMIFDLEATCDKEHGIPPVPEIIDFPVLKVNAETFQIESKFHEFVRPRLYPRISEFCHDLTGITQEDIDNADTLDVVLGRFDKWFHKEVLPHKNLFITCGDWDMVTMMPNHCRREKMKVPWYMRRWHNIRHGYHTVTKDYSTNMKGILKGLQLEKIATNQKSLDDVHNLRNIALELANRGLLFEHTARHDHNVG